jgi:hypothetical protein
MAGMDDIVLEIDDLVEDAWSQITMLSLNLSERAVLHFKSYFELWEPTEGVQAFHFKSKRLNH